MLGVAAACGLVPAGPQAYFRDADELLLKLMGVSICICSSPLKSNCLSIRK